jgi:thiol:disulfide interchange protein DsbD
MRFLTLFIFLISQFTAFSQILEPVKWNMEQKHLGNDEVALIFKAKIDDGWKIYSQFLESDDGPVRTSLNFDKGDHFELLGKAEEDKTNRKKMFDEVFKMDLITMTKEAIFTQKVKVKDFSKPITGYLEFMCCDATRCLTPSEVDFDFALKAPSADNKETASTAAVEQEETPKTEEKIAVTEATANKTAETTSLNTTSLKTDPVTEATTSESATMEMNPSNGMVNPATWSGSIKKLTDTEYELTFVADLQKGWYTYSQFTDPDGPIPTAFFYTEGNHFELIGKAKEIGEIKEAPEPAFGGVVVKKFADNKATFVQKVKVTDAATPIAGELEFMACDNEMCTPPTAVSFNFVPASLSAAVGDDAVNNMAGTTPPSATTEANVPFQDCDHSSEEAEGKSLWSIFILGFFGGLLALLTPCVFPMIPLTVSFFTKGSKTRSKGLANATLYGFFIFAVYIILSIPFHLMDSINPDILNEISTNVWLNIFFFLIFIFFAGSFFGYYELTLPDKWVNKSSTAEGVGGLLGIFFMALTLALVSFSCTGPILGSLLAGALTSDGGAWQLTAGMGGFGFALALPFTVFAAFPTLMNALPKSGGWLNSVKVVLGFLEIAAAFKFLSNADLVSHWGILKVEPLLIIWILTFIGLGLYLLGKIKFPHDSPIKKLGFLRVGLGLASFAFAAYMTTGLIYKEEVKSLNSLSLLSGFAPPACYSVFYPCDCPQNLNCFKDYEQGVTHAKESDKPILLDFTGYACVNCRKMEENVWPIDHVYEKLKEEYVLVSLYVDDKKDLPEAEKIKVKRANGTSRTLRSYGNKWAHFQAERFQTNTQPFYVLLSPDGKTILNRPVGYTPDDKDYAAFLDCGLEAFEKYKQEKSALGLK